MQSLQRSAEIVQQKPPEKVTWTDLASACMEDPARGIEIEQSIKAAARQELRSGHRAAKAMHAGEMDLWEHEQFLAIRSQLADGLNPQLGVEWTLLDMMAQAVTEQLRWSETLALRQLEECERHRLQIEDDGKWVPQAVTQAEATAQSMDMVEKWNRVFLRTLRALRDLRRYAPTINIQTVGQVNVGAQQLNVGTSPQRTDHTTG